MSLQQRKTASPYAVSSELRTCFEDDTDVREMKPPLSIVDGKLCAINEPIQPNVCNTMQQVSSERIKINFT